MNRIHEIIRIPIFIVYKFQNRFVLGYFKYVENFYNHLISRHVVIFSHHNTNQLIGYKAIYFFEWVVTSVNAIYSQ